MISKIETRFIRSSSKRINQGDVLRDFEYYESANIIDKKIQIDKREIPYLIVLTQDCDLESDFRNHEVITVDKSSTHDKILQHILVCPAYPAQKLREGKHLEKMGLKMQLINTKLWSSVTRNNNPRYHYIEKHDLFQIPDLIIDFKHYYSIPRNTLYQNYHTHYIGTMNELFRERLSQRFANYLSRIGLPVIKKDIE